MAAKRKAPSVADIMAAIPKTRSPGALERWMESDPARAARFLAVLDSAREAGASYAAIIVGWDALHEGPDRCPVKQNQVRLMHTERRQRAESHR